MRKQGKIVCIGGHIGKNLFALGAFSFSKVRFLEKNIECDCRSTAFAKVVDDFGVDGTVPFVVVPEFLQRFFIDIGDDDARVVVWLHFHDDTVFAAGGVLDFRIYFEELVIENVFCRFGNKIVFDIAKDEDEEYGDCRKRNPEKKFFLIF